MSKEIAVIEFEVCPELMSSFEFKDETYSLDFVVKEMAGFGHNATNCQYDVPLYTRAGATNGMDTVEDFQEGEVFMKGCIKWDGCSHVYFGDGDGYLHLCGKSNWDRITPIMAKIWERARKIEKFSADVAG